MIARQPHTFRSRLTWVTLFSSLVATALAMTLFVCWQYVATAERQERSYRQLVEVLAATAAAPVVFGDRRTIEETVGIAARLGHLQAVAIRDRDGRVLARRLLTVGKEALDGPVLLSRPWITREGSSLRLTQPIRVDEDIVGWLDMSLEVDSPLTMAARLVAIGAALLVVAVLAAIALNQRMLPLLMRPLDRLSETMEEVARSADFSLRAPSSSDPDFARLLHNFNNMVAEVGRRQHTIARTLQALESARDAAEAANRAKTQFLAAMSHELRTPLNVVIAYADLLEEDVVADGETRYLDDLRVINRSARHLTVLINQVLDFGKIEAKQVTLDLHSFDVGVVAREVAAELEPLAARNNNIVDVDVQGTLPLALLDSTKLRQCLMNLAANACKFTSEGRVTVCVRHDPVQDRLHFVVEDSGIGMEQATIDRLFIPFTQADASTERQYGGTGLGLAITDEFVRLMSGKIHVESTPGRGTRFEMVLPRRIAPRFPPQSPKVHKEDII